MENGTKSGTKLESFKGFFKPKNGDKMVDNLKEKVKKGGAKDAPAPAAKSWRGFFKSAAKEETSGNALLGKNQLQGVPK